MGVRNIDTDFYDYEKDTLGNTAVYTTGCGCCSRPVLVYKENLDEICWNLDQTDTVVEEVFNMLKEKFPGMSWPEIWQRSKLFELSRKEKR